LLNHYIIYNVFVEYIGRGLSIKGTLIVIYLWWSFSQTIFTVFHRTKFLLWTLSFLLFPNLKWTMQ